MYKKLVLIMLSTVLFLCVASCGDKGSGTTKTEDSEAPVIESITQKSGTGGDMIDIYVDYDASKYDRYDFVVFIDGAKVEIKSSVYLSGKQFEFKLPYNLEAGKIAIAVELGGKKSNEVDFEILTPEITKINMSEISFMYFKDSSVLISGKNLGFSIDKVKATLNGQELEIKNVSKTGIEVAVQEGISSGNLVIFINSKEMKSFPITVKAS